MNVTMYFPFSPFFQNHEILRFASIICWRSYSNQTFKDKFIDFRVRLHGYISSAVEIHCQLGVSLLYLSYRISFV